MAGRNVRHLEYYYERKLQLIQTYPHVLVLEGVPNISEIDGWIKDFHLDCCYHVFLYNSFEVNLGYDFFFRRHPDAILFKLTWGGDKDDLLPPVNSNISHTFWHEVVYQYS